MSLRDKIIKKAKERKYETVILMEEEVLCTLHSMKDLEELKNISDEAQYEFIAKQFIDPDTKKPVLTAEDLRETFSSKDFTGLMKKFFDANGVGDVDVAKIEKN